MDISKTDKRTCAQGHTYYKTSDCPVCPICEKDNRPADGFLSILSAPARRALEAQGIKTVRQLSKWSEEALLQLHGIGPSALPKLKQALKQEGLTFKK
jgi:hypothetical protein